MLQLDEALGWSRSLFIANSKSFPPLANRLGVRRRKQLLSGSGVIQSHTKQTGRRTHDSVSHSRSQQARRCKLPSWFRVLYAPGLDCGRTFAAVLTMRGTLETR